MKQMEILCRGSAFLVPVKDKSNKLGKAFHLITCSHIVAPWKWKNYYPQDWLQAVNQSHTYYTAELRHEDGVFATQIELLPRTFHHQKRDLAILHIENEESASEIFESLQADALTLNPKPFSATERFSFFGHEVKGPVAQDGTDLRKPIPRSTMGQFEFATAHQSFVKTGRLLTDGMCGGPVCSEISDSQRQQATGKSMITLSNTLIVRGVTDGIIPDNYNEERYRGLASVIPAVDILSFIEDVESGRAECLEGGESALYVGANTDESVVNMEAIALADEDEKINKKRRPVSIRRDDP